MKNKSKEFILVDDISGKNVDEIIDNCDISEFANQVKKKRLQKRWNRDHIVRT